ncbi:tetratricopeptide repeat protein [Deinococcus puniceus]|uniref:tetratricopeptide repeat protein n=1 Tax=Deinococcus puniceus TaxID=1182568 RepID=UPI0007C93FA2|nr:tetratricopeptide repeat protein [Deinococcus puniceus]
MRLRTLGGVSIEGGKYGREKPLLVLAYLALEGPQPRRHLAELFWPSAEGPQQLNNLNQHLIRLRPLGHVVHEDGQLLRTDLTCDAREFQDHVCAGRQADALNAYSGAFLTGLKTELGEELEEWVLGVRETLARAARALHLTLAEDWQARGDVVQAAHGAEAAYRLPGAPPPEPEDLPRLFRLLSAGQHPLADTIRREARELGMTLTPQPVSSAPPLVGRTAELAQLQTLAAGQVGWLTGVPSIGKSALLSALAVRGGWRVLLGRAGLPFATLEPLASRPLTSTAEALALLGDPRLRVAIDGWEDADDATRAALSLAARQRPGAALLIAARSAPALPVDLHLTLGPLREADLSGHPGALAATGGNPALLRAFLRGASAHQSLEAHLAHLGPQARALLLALAAQDPPHLNATRAALDFSAADFAHTLDGLAREGLTTPEGHLRTPAPARELLAAQPIDTQLLHLRLARAHPHTSGWVHWQAAQHLWEDTDREAAAKAAHWHADQEMKRGYPARAAATLELAPQTDEVRLLRGWALIECGKALEALNLLASLPHTANVLAALGTATYKLGHFSEALAWAAALPTDGSLSSAHGSMIRGNVALKEHEFLCAQKHYRLAAQVYRLNNDVPSALIAENLLATLAVQLGAEARQIFPALVQASSAYARQKALVLCNFAYSLTSTPDTTDKSYLEAENLYREAMRLQEILGDRHGIAQTLNSLAVNKHLQGKIGDAKRLYYQALECLKGSGDVRSMGLILSNIGEIEEDFTGFSENIEFLNGTGHGKLAEIIHKNLIADSFVGLEQSYVSSA